jgi:hypothetical protein
VLDGAVAVFDGGNGVEPQSETVWRQADKYGVPRIAFINKMDKVGADFEMCVDSIRERLGAVPVPIQYPVGAEDSAPRRDRPRPDEGGVFDEESLGVRSTSGAIPADLLPRCKELREQLIEACADVDDAVMEKFLGRPAESTSPRRRSTPPSRKGRVLQVRPGALRLGVQEQGRAAPARRGRELPALAARHPPVEGTDPEQEGRPRVRARPATTSPSRRWRSRS